MPWWLALLSGCVTPADAGPCRVADGPVVVPSGGHASLQVALQPVLTGCGQITEVAFLPGRDDALAVLDKEGTLYAVDLDDKVARKAQSVAVLSQSEMGLLGVAFHPGFATNGLYVLSYNPADGTPRSAYELWRWTGSFPEGGGEKVRNLLSVDQPWANHDGGQIHFGPDGLLYIALGDGGSANDPQGNGQNTRTLLGKILRIDVDHPAEGAQYGIPADNPFAAPGADGAPEIWAWGLRNPWKFSFLADGRMIAGDVGQNKWEEITPVVPGKNHGWNRKEGSHCFEPATDCGLPGMVDPFWEYDHWQGVSVTGGYEVLSDSVPGLKGRYVFGDFGSGAVWAMAVPASGTASDVALLGTFPAGIATFGRDASGRLYLGNLGEGRVYRFVAKGAP